MWLHAGSAVIVAEPAVVLRPKFRPFPAKPPSAMEMEMQANIRGKIAANLAPMLIIFGMSAVPSRVAYNLVEERVKRKKHLQVLMGVRPSEYWLQHWCFDFLALSAVTVPPPARCTVDTFS